MHTVLFHADIVAAYGVDVVGKFERVLSFFQELLLTIFAMVTHYEGVKAAM